MSKPNSVGQATRQVFVRTRTTRSLAGDANSASESASGSNNSDSHSSGNPQIPRLNTVKVARNAIPEMEMDGYLLKSQFNSSKDSDGDADEMVALALWGHKFDVEVAEYDRLTAKAHARERTTAAREAIVMQEGCPVIVAGQKPLQPQPSSEPRFQRLGRSRMMSETFRGGFRLTARASLNADSMQSLTLGDLAKSRWVAKGEVKVDEESFPILDKLPAKFRRALANEYKEFSGKVTNQGLVSEEREEQLKQALAKKFLALTLLGPDSEFDKSKIGSMTAINQYLSRTYGLQIDSAPVSAREDAAVSPRSPSSPRSQKFSSSSSSSSSSSPRRHASTDFRDLLVQDAVHRSRNFQVNYSLDLSHLDDDSFEKKIIDGEIEANKKHEKVGKGERADLTNIFQRDFKNSTYEYETVDGTIVKLQSIDEFVNFIGDSLQTELPKAVSAYACQTLGIIIKNLLFLRRDANGNLQSPVRLFDGTPVNFSALGAARYRFKKGSDGAVTLHYRSEIDTGEASKTGKAAAKLILSPDGSKFSSRQIDHAKAVMNLDIVFHPDGTVRMGTLNLRAEGWNQLDE